MPKVVIDKTRQIWLQVVGSQSSVHLHKATGRAVEAAWGRGQGLRLGWAHLVRGGRGAAA